MSEKVKSLDPKRKVLPIRRGPCPISDEIPKIVERVLAEFGRIDILVNNAGRNVRGPAEDVLHPGLGCCDRSQSQVCLFMAQAVGRVMIRQGYGKIINTASLTSFIGLPNMVAYCASRGGVAQMTKALAVEWAKYGVRVNAIAPGYFLTKLTQPLFEDPKRKEWILSKIPMGRSGDAGERSLRSGCLPCFPCLRLHHRSDPYRRWRLDGRMIELNLLLSYHAF